MAKSFVKQIPNVRILDRQWVSFNAAWEYGIKWIIINHDAAYSSIKKRFLYRHTVQYAGSKIPFAHDGRTEIKFIYIYNSRLAYVLERGLDTNKYKRIRIYYKMLSCCQCKSMSIKEFFNRQLSLSSAQISDNIYHSKGNSYKMRTNFKIVVALFLGIQGEKKTFPTRSYYGFTVQYITYSLFRYELFDQRGSASRTCGKGKNSYE